MTWSEKQTRQAESLSQLPGRVVALDVAVVSAADVVEPSDVVPGRVVAPDVAVVSAADVVKTSLVDKVKIEDVISEVVAEVELVRGLTGSL